MPSTLELRCEDGDCEVDMFELHFTYDIHDDPKAADFACPLCGGTECLEEIVV